MDKSTILKAFNEHFVEFVDDISRVFPNNKDVNTTKNALLAIRKANPRMIMLCWKGMWPFHTRRRSVMET